MQRPTKPCETTPVHLFNEQARVLAEQQSRIRRRVMWEMFGLLLVVVGTAVEQPCRVVNPGTQPG